MQQDSFGQQDIQSQRRSYSADDLGYPQERGGLFKNPVVATLILLVTAGVFAGIILLAFPKGDGEDVLPVVRADTAPYKAEPKQRGGTSIPNRESTIFTEMRNADDGQLVAVENLLEIKDPYEETKVVFSDEAIALKQAAKPVVDTVKAVVEPPEHEGVLASLGKPDSLHPAGGSPETIAFVKSVLEDKEKSADIVAKAEPAAGATEESVVKSVQKSPQKSAQDIVQEIVQKEAVQEKTVQEAVQNNSAADAVSAGTHFVQLSSIADEARAPAEWAKMQKKYPFLVGAPYRVQRKDLGAKGVFYRVQAGPFSKGVAVAKCDAVKGASGGCFLVGK